MTNHPADEVVVEPLLVVVVLGGFVVVVAAEVVVVAETLASCDADGGFGNDTPLGTNPTVTSSSLLEITTFDGSPVYIFGEVERTELQTAVSS